MVKRGRGKQKAPNAVGLSKKQMKKEQRQRGSKAAKTAGAQPASMGGQRRHGNESTDSPIAPCALPDLLPEQWTGTPMQMHVSSADDAMHETGSMMMTASGSDTALAAHGHEPMLDVPTDVMTTDVTMLAHSLQSDETTTTDVMAGQEQMFDSLAPPDQRSSVGPLEKDCAGAAAERELDAANQMTDGEGAGASSADREAMPTASGQTPDNRMDASDEQHGENSTCAMTQQVQRMMAANAMEADAYARLIRVLDGDHPVTRSSVAWLKVCPASAATLAFMTRALLPSTSPACADSS